MTWSGPVSGNVHKTYDSSFRLASESVTGGQTMAEPAMATTPDQTTIVVIAMASTLRISPRVVACRAGVEARWVREASQALCSAR